MRIFANALYTLLLLILISPLTIGAVTSSFSSSHQENQSVDRVDEAEKDSAANGESLLLGMFLCSILLGFQIARLKFKLKYSYLYLFLGCWLLVLFSFATDDFDMWSGFRQDWVFASWMACFIALIPAFGWMYWETYVRSDRRSGIDSRGETGSLSAERAVS